MNCELKSFDIIKDGKILDHVSLFRRGYINEVRNQIEVIHTGIDAEKKYNDVLEQHKKLATFMGAQIIEK